MLRETIQVFCVILLMTSTKLLTYLGHISAKNSVILRKNLTQLCSLKGN